MDLIYKNFFSATIIVIIGAILSFAVSKVFTLILGKLAKRTKSETDDYIVECIANIIKPLGYLITLSLAWDSLTIGPGLDNVLYGTISQKMYFGGIVRYKVDINSKMLVQVEEFAPIGDGSNNEKDKISILIPSDRLMLFPIKE